RRLGTTPTPSAGYRGRGGTGTGASGTARADRRPPARRGTGRGAPGRGPCAARRGRGLGAIGAVRRASRCRDRAFSAGLGDGRAGRRRDPGDPVGGRLVATRAVSCRQSRVKTPAKSGE